MDAVIANLIPEWSLVYLVVGYLAYRNAYAGLNRHHTARDSLFMILIFAALIGWPVFNFLLFLLNQFCSFYDDYEKILNATAALITGLSAIGIGLLWRRIGKQWCQNFLAKWDIREDGIPSAWDSFMLATHQHEVWQAAITTNNGEVYHLNDYGKYQNAPMKGLYLGTDGDVALIVDAIEVDGGVFNIADITDNYGTRVTYIPAKEIKEVNIRMK